MVSGDVIGGHEMQLVHLVEKTVGMFDHVRILCGSDETFQYFGAKHDAVEKVDFNVRGKIWHQWLGAPTIVPVLREYVMSADVVLVSGGTIEACIAASRASKLIDPAIPVIAYMPMYIDRALTHGLVGWAYNFLAKQLARTIDQFITVNRIQATLLKRHLDRPATYIENEIRAVSAPLTSYGRRLIFVGRFDDRQKGIIDLIKFADSPGNPYRDLYLIGDGPDKDLILQRAELASNIKVHLMGWMGSGAIDAFLGQEDCLVMNSAWEGEPLVIREFSARGLPCVVRDIAGIRGVTRKILRYRTQSELLEILQQVHAGTARAPCVRPPQSLERATMKLRKVFFVE